MSNGKLFLSRQQDLLSTIGALEVFIDSKMIGELPNNAEVSFDLTNGEHLLQLKRIGIASQPLVINIPEGGNTFVKCGMHKNYMKCVFGVIALYTSLYVASELDHYGNTAHFIIFAYRLIACCIMFWLVFIKSKTGGILYLSITQPE